MRLLLDAPQPCAVRADEARIEQVLYNLVQNALQHGQPGGTATGRVRTDAGKYVRCEVVDEGPGISPDEQTRIRDRFRRGAGAEPALGWRSSNRFPSRMGAPYGVESAIGKGACLRPTRMTSSILPTRFTLLSLVPSRMRT